VRHAVAAADRGLAQALVPAGAGADADGGRVRAGDGPAAAGAAADGAGGHHPADPDRGRREVGEGSAELHERADVPADRPDHRADGEPGEDPAVAVRGAVPGAEPDDPQAGAQRGDHRPGMAGVPGGRVRRRPGAVAAGRAPVPPGEAGDLGLRPGPGNEEARPRPGFSVLDRGGGRGAYCAGVKLIVRRVVTGAGTGSERQRRPAASASRSKVRGGLDWTTRADVTDPSTPTVNSTCTSPDVPERSASGG